MSSTVSIYVAISVGEGVHNHWGVFIDGPREKDKNFPPGGGLGWSILL
ncbi:hypothetical protein PDIG_67200 [Penicillium digitatum PHI26]|uniref:Uncharacterized protein n=2 Tax=Penicillium digitatum TaxID=36651 RepID=K9G6L6_PEND2|nr:hypothetical protein PDIP_76500 [Penicillium digitatum Pd1]EKV06829.1 hypothetical protein PDIP_76500 [Penicillium digitatum Pd1]EKV08856.1 hypothetical protein PDIG_67200 [Penicillium digitatum PHI26]